MKHFFLVISLLIITLLNGCQEKGSWLSFDYDTAYAYYYANDTEKTGPWSEVLVDGELNESIINIEGEKLNQNQIDFLGEALNGNMNDGPGLPSDCYLPHHGIVFYKSDKIVADISICFMCERVKSNPSNNLLQSDILKPMFTELGIPILPEDFKP